MVTHILYQNAKSSTYFSKSLQGHIKKQNHTLACLINVSNQELYNKEDLSYCSGVF